MEDVQLLIKVLPGRVKSCWGNGREIAPSCDMSCVGVDGSDSHHPEKTTSAMVNIDTCSHPITVLVTGDANLSPCGSLFEARAYKPSDTQTLKVLVELMKEHFETWSLHQQWVVLQLIEQFFNLKVQVYSSLVFLAPSSASDTKNMGEKYDQFGERRKCEAKSPVSSLLLLFIFCVSIFIFFD